MTQTNSPMTTITPPIPRSIRNLGSTCSAVKSGIPQAKNGWMSWVQNKSNTLSDYTSDPAGTCSAVSARSVAATPRCSVAATAAAGSPERCSRKRAAARAVGGDGPSGYRPPPACTAKKLPMPGWAGWPSGCIRPSRMGYATCPPQPRSARPTDQRLRRPFAPPDPL